MVSQKNSPGDILEVRGEKCHKKCHKNPVYFLNCSTIDSIIQIMASDIENMLGSALSISNDIITTAVHLDMYWRLWYVCEALK